MNSKIQEFSRLLTEIQEQVEVKQEMTLDELMEELKSKLSILLDKKSE